MFISRYMGKSKKLPGNKYVRTYQLVDNYTIVSLFPETLQFMYLMCILTHVNHVLYDTIQFKNFSILTFGSERGTAKTSDAEGTRFAIVPQIGMISMPQVRVGIVRSSCYAISRQSHAFLCNSRILVHITVKIALGFALCNFLTVTGKIILELHSNVCDYLY